MRAGLALLLLLSTMLGGNCQDTDSQQGEHAMATLTYSSVVMYQVHKIMTLTVHKVSRFPAPRQQYRLSSHPDLGRKVPIW